MKRRTKRKLKWSLNLAYAIGLITTDGCLSQDKRHIIITSTDYQLLQTVLACLNKTNKITFNIPDIRSKKIPYHIQIGDII